jgi:hypothetical protein
MLRVFDMLKRLVAVGSLAVVSLTSYASTAESDHLEVITDIKQIAAVRQELNKPNLSFQTITIVRLTDNQGQRVDVTSVGPAVVGFQQGGPPAARSIMTFVPKPDRLVLFTQDVKNRTAFRLEIAVDQLTAGRSIRFPVVQPSGELVEQVFTVKEIITR